MASANVQTLENVIGGRRVAASGETIEIRNPASDEVVAIYRASCVGDVAAAVAVAAEAQQAWRRVPPAERARVLLRFHHLLTRHRGGIAEILTLEHGKTRREAELEVDRGIENVEVACGAPTLMQGAMLEDATAGIDEYVIRQPLGVCASLSPFNFPAMIPLWSLPYALACGNSLVAKASPRVPMTLSRMFDLLAEAGLPDGVANLVLGDVDASRALVEHPTVRTISFVGSTRVGREVYAQAATAGKRVQVGAGAKNFCVVMSDADPAKIVPNIVASAMGCTGQRCLALSGVIAVGDAHAALSEALVEAAGAIRVGPGMDDRSDMGPVISADARQRIEAAIDKGQHEGAKVRLDGRGCRVDGFADGYWVGPTLLDDCEPKMSVAREEIFGPVLSIVRVGDLSEAIELINSSNYGNAAAIYTNSGAAARRFRYEVDAGNIGVNIGVAAPMAFFHFGGAKDSFFGDLHAQGRDAFDFFTQRKVSIERWYD